VETTTLFLVLTIAYLAAVGWYVITVLATRKRQGKSGSGSRAAREARPRESSGFERSESRRSEGERSHDSRKRRQGKRCPQCRKIIDAVRTRCQHCGHEFETEPADEENGPDDESGE